MTCRLEPVSRAMAGSLSMLHRACFLEDPWDMRAITEIMGIAGFFGQIALKDETPAGFALALDLCQECEVLSLGVLPERRRTGIGSALLDSVCTEARLHGAESIVLEVAANNIAARGFYAVAGFIPVGRRRNYYWQAGRRVDALVLRRAVAGASILL